MADNELALMQWQIGKQSALATKVTGVTKLIGVTDGTITPVVESSLVEEQRGTLTPGYVATQDKKGGTGKLSVEVYAEQAAHWFDCLFGLATPGATPDYLRTYSAPGAKPTLLPISLMRGSSEGAYGLTGAVLNELTLKGEKNKRLSAELGFIGHSVEEHTLGSLSDPATATPFHSNQMTMFLDTWAGTMGATALGVNVASFELGLNLNKVLQYGLGAITPAGVNVNKSDAGSNQLKLSLEFTAAKSKTWLDAVLGTGPFQAQIRLLYTVSTNVTLQIDYAGFCAEAPEIFSDDDGVAQCDFTLTPQYHATLATWCKIALKSPTAVTFA